MNIYMTNPLKIWANSVELTTLLSEAQAVIAMRVIGLAGFWSVTPYENKRMVSEKAYALTKSASEATRASLRGAPPDAVIAAAIKPIRQKTRANARRLSKRGPKVR